MLYLIDDANLESIKTLVQYFPISGVTTNPTIIANEGKNVIETLKAIRDIIGPDLALHAQVLSDNCEDIVKEAYKLRDAVGGLFYVKVPVSGEGLKAMSVLKELGFNVTATAIFTAQQALLSAKAGADFVAPYINRLDNFSADGVNVLKDIIHLLDSFNLDTKVVAASFKNTQQVHNTALAGSHAATISCDLFEQLVYHPLTSSAIMEFEEKGEEFYKF